MPCNKIYEEVKKECVANFIPPLNGVSLGSYFSLITLLEVEIMLKQCCDLVGRKFINSGAKCLEFIFKQVLLKVF